MAGLLLNVSLIAQDWGQAVFNLADALATVNGINTLIADAGRLPPGGEAGLEALDGMTTTDAGLYVATFGDLANLYKVAHGQQAQPGASDFFFNARQLLGTKAMPT
jgi:hypothetical protein